MKGITYPDYLCTLSRFRHDVRDHRMTVEHEDGIFRSVYFGKPGTSNLHFRLTSWPGHLAMSGDMGGLMLSRVRDMFEWCHDPLTPRPDMRYWQEKLVGMDRDGVETFDEDFFVKAVRDEFRAHSFPSFRAARVIWRDLNDDLIDHRYEFTTARDAVNEAMRFRADVDGYTFDMPEFYEHRLTRPSFAFEWQCLAIRWGLKRYWQSKDGTSQTDHDRRVLRGEI